MTRPESKNTATTDWENPLYRNNLRRVVTVIATVLLAGIALASCSDDGDDATGGTSTTEATSTTTAETTTTSSAPADGATGDVETTELLEFLQDEDPEIGDLFDWNTQAGVIAITYVGVQTVQLFTYGELDADAAVAACELASDHVFPIDDSAEIQVLVGEYPNGTVVASVEGVDGTCAAA